MILPDPIAKLRDEEAENCVIENEKIMNYPEVEIRAFCAGANWGFEQGILYAVELLMQNAGNYCACQDAPDYLMCSKHAQTHSAEILESKMKGMECL